MKTTLSVLKCIGLIILSFVIIVIVNLAHDPLINAVSAGQAKNHIPTGTTAEIISLLVVFIAGLLAAYAVSLLAGKQRIILLVILTVIFVAADLNAVLTDLAQCDVWYRVLVVVLVPAEVWCAYLITKLMTEKYQNLGL